MIRHGETVANTEKCYLGHSDSPLTITGVEQAQLIAEQLGSQPITAVFSSDLGRSLASAQPLADELRLPVFPDGRLREVSFGDIEMLTYEQAMHAYPVEVNAWYNDLELLAPPGGETVEDLRKRLYNFMSDLAQTKHSVVAVYTHGGVCNILFSEATGQAFGSQWSQPGDVFELNICSTSSGPRLQISTGVTPERLSKKYTLTVE